MHRDICRFGLISDNHGSEADFGFGSEADVDDDARIVSFCTYSGRNGQKADIGRIDREIRMAGDT